MGKSIPILAYHHVNTLIDDMVTVSVKHFEDQMAFLQKQGFTSLFISETVKCLQGKRPLPPKPVAITFDDGFRDNFQFAFPLLKKFKIKATIFVVTGWMGERRDAEPSERFFTHRECKEMVDQGIGSRIALTWQEVKVMEESGLVQVESHGHSHIKDLYRDIPALKEDWRLSQESFLRHLKRESRHLCWPGGRYDEKSLKAARELGFLSTCTTKRGVNILGSDLMRLKRVTAKNDRSRWIKKTLQIFSNPFLGNLYAKIKPA